MNRNLIRIKRWQLKLILTTIKTFVLGWRYRLEGLLYTKLMVRDITEEPSLKNKIAVYFNSSAYRRLQKINLKLKILESRYIKINRSDPRLILKKKKRVTPNVQAPKQHGTYNSRLPRAILDWEQNEKKKESDN